MPCTPVTAPIVTPSASSTGPCSMCSSTYACGGRAGLGCGPAYPMRNSSSPSTAPSIARIASASSSGIPPANTRLPSMSGAKRLPSSSVKNATASGRASSTPEVITVSSTSIPASTPRVPSNRPPVATVSIWLPVITGASVRSRGHVPTTFPSSSTSIRSPRSRIQLTTRSRPRRSSSVSASRAQPPPSMAPISASASRRARRRGNEIARPSTMARLIGRAASSEEVAWSDRHPRARGAGCVADRGDDGRRRRDRRRLPDALRAEWRARLWHFDQNGVDGGCVERGRYQIVGEAGVAYLPALHDELLHHRQTDTLRDATLDLTGHLERIEDTTHVLRGGEVDDAHESELRIDIDNRAVCCARERDVRVTLAVGVEG